MFIVQFSAWGLPSADCEGIKVLRKEAENAGESVSILQLVSVVFRARLSVNSLCNLINKLQDIYILCGL